MPRKSARPRSRLRSSPWHTLRRSTPKGRRRHTPSLACRGRRPRRDGGRGRVARRRALRRSDYLRRGQAARRDRGRDAAVRGRQGRVPDHRAARHRGRADGQGTRHRIPAVRRRQGSGDEPRPRWQGRAGARRRPRQAHGAPRRSPVGIASLLRRALLDAPGMGAGVHAVSRGRALSLRPRQERAEDQSRAVLIRAAPLAAFVALGAASLLFDLTLPLRLPSDSDWAEAAASLRVRAKPGDEVQIWPPWAERARLFIEAVPVRTEEDLRAADYPGVDRVWLLALTRSPRNGVGKAREALRARGATAGERVRFGSLELEPWELHGPRVLAGLAGSREGHG